MQFPKSVNTPMTGGNKLTAYCIDLVRDIQLHRSIVGALHYASITRLEIICSFNVVCQFMQTSLESDWQAVK